MSYDGADGYRIASDALAKVWAPHRPLGAAKWADKYRRLSGKSAAEAGKWHNSRIPYLKGIMDALDETHPAPLVVFKKSSQVGGSECGLNWIGRTIHQNPASFLALFPTEKDARKWVRTRLDSMLSETPELRKIIPPGRRSDSGNTLQEKHYPGGVLFTGSANIASDVASVSVQNLLLDEVDRMPLMLEGEGDPVEIAKARNTTFPRNKVFEISSPTTEESSRIHADWLISTMDRFYVPCPECGHMQYLRFEQLKWPDGEPSKARYHCEDCAESFAEHHKTDMLAAGEWRAEHPDRETLIKGFHISGLYSPIGLGRAWTNHAATYDRARGSPTRMQVFYNTRLGEVVKSERIKVEWEGVKERAEPYKLRTIPRGVLVLTAGVDVQKDRVEAQIIGHGRYEHTTVIDHTVIYGDPTRSDATADGEPSVWSKLDEYLAAEMLNSCGVAMRSVCTLVDSGNWQHEVTNYTRTRRTRGIFASKGSSVETKQPIGRPTLVDVNYRGATYKRGAEQYQVGVSELKRVVYKRLEADMVSLPADRLIAFSADLPPEYFRQLVSEVYDPKEGWVQLYDRNETLDTLILALAAGMHHSVQVHRLRELDWQRLEQLYEPAVAVQQPIGAALVRPSRGFLPTAAMTGKVR
jgi:phage terminase large subunit GpA-like protein